ncbi:MAG: histidinol dehydrogenase, partial [Stellaceae bacterium]
MPKRLSVRAAGFAAEFRALLDQKREGAADVDAAVAAIIEDVAHRGDAALLDYTRRFDRIALESEGLRVTPEEIAAGAAAVPPETLAALRLAARRIEAFHRRQVPAPIDFIDETGVHLAQRWTPIAAAGLYVPGGT